MTPIRRGLPKRFVCIRVLQGSNVLKSTQLDPLDFQPDPWTALIWIRVASFLQTVCPSWRPTTYQEEQSSVEALKHFQLIVMPRGMQPLRLKLHLFDL